MNQTDSPTTTAVPGKNEPPGKNKPMVRQRVRIRFCKQGDLRLIGHRDLMRCFERLFRRAELPLGMSEGFHPKPRMSFPSALPVGIEGNDEVMELELARTLDAEELTERIVPHLPCGLRLDSVEVLPQGVKKARLAAVAYEIPVPLSQCGGLPERIDRLMATTSFPIQRSRGRKPVDLRPLLLKLRLDEGTLRIRLRVPDTASAGPRDVLATLDLSDLERNGCHLTRTEVEIVG